MMIFIIVCVIGIFLFNKYLIMRNDGLIFRINIVSRVYFNVSINF